MHSSHLTAEKLNKINSNKQGDYRTKMKAFVSFFCAHFLTFTHCGEDAGRRKVKLKRKKKKKMYTQYAHNDIEKITSLHKPWARVFFQTMITISAVTASPMYNAHKLRRVDIYIFFRLPCATERTLPCRHKLVRRNATVSLDHNHNRCMCLPSYFPSSTVQAQMVFN